MPSKIVNIRGLRFGRLVAMELTELRIDRSVAWICMCDCGNWCIRSGRNLRNERTTSCGCKRDEFLRGETAIIHGMSKLRTYKIWSSMKHRCADPKNKYYGGKGVSVCKRWAKSFESFLDDMGLCPDGYQIDRKDGKGNYEPSNCRWVTVQEQQRNKENVGKISVDGIARSLSGWSEVFGIKKSTISERLRRGWPDQKAVSEPVR